ncbi:MAG: hypothetical protein ACKOQ7_01310 [Actinomycetota bacterium]
MSRSMPSFEDAHTNAVAAIDRWVKVSKQTRSMSGSAAVFVDDMRNERNTAVWSRVNVEQILPYRLEAPRLLLVVRSGALFLPILLTWLALSQVIGPFAQFIQNQQPSANFLWFWQANPGESFAGVWELGHVALTDAAVLAFLTVLAMRIEWWQTSRAERAEHAYSEMLSAVEMYFVSVREK